MRDRSRSARPAVIGAIGTVGVVGTTSWGRLVERLCYLLPATIGVGLIGVLEEVGLGGPVVQRGLVAIGTAGYAIVSILLAVAIFVDARDVRHVGGWTPTPWLYALFAVFLAPFVAVFYLSRRHEHFGTPAERSTWWLVVALSLGTTLLGAAIALVAFALEIPTLVVAATGTAGAVAVGVFPIAIHRDAATVCLERASWRPNPGLYLGLAFASLFVPGMQPVLAAYYLSRRKRTVGLSWPSWRSS